jgi:hypothetical protein
MPYIFSSIIKTLIQLENYPGDFGQTIDFKDTISPNDFELRENE